MPCHHPASILAPVYQRHAPASPRAGPFTDGLLWDAFQPPIEQHTTGEEATRAFARGCTTMFGSCGRLPHGIKFLLPTTHFASHSFCAIFSFWRGM